jgi:Family of unknown function (DUF5999)
MSTVAQRAPQPAPSSETVPCRHLPPCPAADAPDRHRAHVLVAHPEQGWSLLCNGVIAFDDLGALLPGRTHGPAGSPPVRRAH